MLNDLEQQDNNPLFIRNGPYFSYTAIDDAIEKGKEFYRSRNLLFNYDIILMSNDKNLYKNIKEVEESDDWNLKQVYLSTAIVYMLQYSVSRISFL